MRIIFCIIFSVISFSASAQWGKISSLFRKKVQRPPVIYQAVNHSVSQLPGPKIYTPEIYVVQLGRSKYNYQQSEAAMIRQAQHNMSLGIFYDASYNFSELARLYMEQNRLSEAKWYLLQSNNISRRQNDDKHTISNLIDLAMVKANIGDFVQAFQDLAEARDIAKVKGLDDNLKEIDQTIMYLKKKQG